jgi:gamma-glutamyltranspeptidase
MLCTQSSNYRLFRLDVLDFLDGEIVQHTLDEMIFLRRSKVLRWRNDHYDDNFKQALKKAGHTIKEGEMTSGLTIIWRMDKD